MFLSSTMGRRTNHYNRSGTDFEDELMHVSDDDSQSIEHVWNRHQKEHLIYQIIVI
jgi:hypothetical protein